MSTAAAEWSLWSTGARLVVADPSVLAGARRRVEDYLQEVDDAANRFRADAEINQLAPGADGRVRLSPVLTDLVREALDAAAFTDGDVDPTVGTALRRIGYDRDLELVTKDGGPLRAVLRPVPGWRRLRLDGSVLGIPAVVRLDLGATA